MDFFERFRQLTIDELKSLAFLCAGAAFLVIIALILSGNTALFTNNNQAAAVTTYNSNGTYTWTAPAGVNQVWVTVVGGGGGGGDGSWSIVACVGDAYYGGGGGSGGYINNQLVSVTPGQPYTVVVGTGGAGGVENCGDYNSNATAGGLSSFGTIVATGGGRGGSSSGGPVGVGGTPGGVSGFIPGGCGGNYGGGNNSSGYGKGGDSFCGGTWGSTAQSGQNGYVSINTSPVAISASPQSVTSGGSSVVSWASANVDANSCSVTGPSGTIVAALPPGFGQTSLTSGSFSAPSFSSDGSKVFITGGAYPYSIYSSSNGGATWTQLASAGTNFWSGVISSADGTHLTAAALAANGYIFTSTDSGTTWSTHGNSSGARNWMYFTASSDGMKIAADSGSGAGPVYTSVDGGVTWVPRSGMGSNYWGYITSSADGTKLALAPYPSVSGYIWTSADSGATWSTHTNSSGSRLWKGIASDSTGSKLVAVSSVGTFTSSDSGTTWTQRNSLVFGGVVSSQDGTHLAANGAAGTYISIDSGVTWSLLSTVNSNPGITSDGTRVMGGTSTGVWGQYPGATAWVARNTAATHNWEGIASSQDGTHLAVTDYGGYIWTSIDSGATWSTNSNASGARNWAYITSDATGKYLAAVVWQGNVYTSNNYGASGSWTDHGALGSSFAFWTSITSSQDGAKLAATVYGNSSGHSVYTSINSGTTWSLQNNSPNTGNYSGTVTSSADGNKLAFTTNGLPVYTSTNSGLNWSAQSSPGGTATQEAITSSADGTKLATVISGGDIWTAVDSGSGFVWADRTSSLGTKNWNGIVSSADGNRLAAVVNGGYIYTSINSGLAWTQTSSGSRSWWSVTSSADGSKFAATDHGGYIYTYQNDYGTISASTTATNITSPQTYTISCTIGGAPVSAQTTITVTAPNSTLTLTPPTQTLSQNSQAGLTWTSTNINAGSCAVTQADPTGVNSTLSSIGAVNGDGMSKNTATLAQTGTYNYQLSCTAPFTTGNNGTLTGSPTTGVAGKFGQAVTFNGGNYASASALDGYLSGKSAATISVWFKNPGQTINRPIIAGWWYSDNFRIDFHSTGAPGGNVEFYYSTSGNHDNVITSNSAYADSNWHHAVGSYSSTSGAQLYIDGVLIGSNAANGTIVEGDRFCLAAACNTAGANLLYFTGSIDDARVYSRALSSDEVSTLYNGGHITTGLVGYWPLDTAGGISGTTAYDLAGGITSTSASVLVTAPPALTLTPPTQTIPSNTTANLAWTSSNINANSCSVAQIDPTNMVSAFSAIGVGDNTNKTTAALSQVGSYTYKLACTAPYTAGNNGTLTGSPTTGVAGKFGQAVTFNGSDFMTLATPVSLASGTWTISTWFMTPLPVTTLGGWRTLTRGNAGDHQVIVDTNGLLGTYDNIGGTAFHSSGYNVSGLSAGWHHLAAVGSGASTVFYIDGASVGTATYKSVANVYSIGNYTGGGQQFGTLDDARIYSRALSSDEVSTLYNGGHITTGLVGYWPLDTAGGISGTTAYDLAGGVTTKTATVTVNVSAPQPASIIFNPSSIRVQKGNTATLNWTVNGMAAGISCVMSPSLPGGVPAWNNLNPWSASGATAAINATTKYTLACGNGVATTTGSANVGLVPGFIEI